MILHKNHKFCPECQSVMIRRVHRSWIQKYIFLQKPTYKCGNCQAIFSQPLLEEDLKKMDIGKVNKDKPTISLEEIHVMDLKKKKEIEKYEKTIQAAYKKGFEEGLNKSIQH